MNDFVKVNHEKRTPKSKPALAGNMTALLEPKNLHSRPTALDPSPNTVFPGEA